MLFKHLSTRGSERIRPTERQVRYWLQAVNRECFGGKLPMPEDISFREMQDIYAMVELSDDSYDLVLQPREYLRHELLALLGHEAAHVAVWFLDKDRRTDHGPRFMAYGPKLAEVGLPLHPFYYGPTA